MLVSEFRGDTALALEPPTGWQFVLERPGQRAVVTEVGAAVRSWRAGGRERLDAFPVGSAGGGLCGKALVPWPDEVRGARYRFGGAEHRLPFDRDGLLLWVNWRPVRRGPDHVALEYVLHPQPGYPFTIGVEVEYALEAAGLSATLRATNLGSGPAPFGAGFHPCLRCDGLAAGLYGGLERDASGVARLRAGDVCVW